VPTVDAFVANIGSHAASACFDVAGPVIGGRAHLTNLPWHPEEAAPCRDLGMQRVGPLNDLRAIAHVVPHMQPTERVEIDAGEAMADTPIAVKAEHSGFTVEHVLAAAKQQAIAAA
jgi:glucokinase